MERTDMRSEKAKMLAGALYDAGDPELLRDRAHAADVLRRFNATEDRGALASLLGSFGDRSTVRAPFFCDYGYNVHLGAGVFVNFGCVFLDVCPIEIGDGTQIGPGVQLYAADHPREASVRRSGLELGREIRVGPNVWIGGGAIVLPGVTLGDDAIVGAGSVVTRDVAAGETVMGNPARVRGGRR